MDGGTVILMNWPAHPDGPPVKRGLPYSAIAHLAENVKPFVAMALALRARGFSAPKIYAADYDAGLIVLEDLGNELVVEGDPPRPMIERYARAADLLVALHGLDLPGVLPAAPKVDYALPSYDLDAFLIEAELILDWYLPHRNAGASAEVRAHFQALWRDALRPVLEAPKSWVLRDFHSPNILWLEEREGIAKVGLLDFQDAVLGPPAYDLASLLQDARVDVPEDAEIALFSRYVAARRAGRSGLRCQRLRAALRDACSAARDQDPRHFCAARPARPQAAISPPHAAGVELPAPCAGASGTCGARCLVCAQRSAARMTIRRREPARRAAHQKRHKPYRQVIFLLIWPHKLSPFGSRLRCLSLPD